MSALPFAPLTEEQAVGAALDHWAYRAESAERLDSEQDDSFRLHGPDGGRVIKVAAPDADAGQLRLLCSLGDWLSDAPLGMSVQVVIRTIAGDPIGLIDHDGSLRAARLLRYLPGTLLSDVFPTTPQWKAIGRGLASLDEALASFLHPDVPTTVLWDLRRLGDLRDSLPLVDARVRASVHNVVDRFVDRVLPRLEGLPHQVIHNDFNRGNLIVDLATDAVLSGIIDFGDAMVGPRVFDPAIAAAYAITAEVDPWAHALPLVEGYRERLTLTDAELEVLAELVIARQAQRLLLNAVIVRSLPQSERHTQRYRDETAGQLSALLRARRPEFDRTTTEG